MKSELHWNILDDKRREILSLLKQVTKEGFYLAGGTGLALQLGHRDSIDFDFFLPSDYNTVSLVSTLESVFAAHSLVITQQEKNTISCLVDETIQLSFFGYPYPLIKPSIASEYFTIASIEDIGCMKLSAITGRSVEKDYVDLYFILKQIPLNTLLDLSTQKHSSLDHALILKSLVYFDDVLAEPVLFKEGHDVSFDEVKAFLKKEVAAYFANQ
jgi:predicted nucleotidyltransferase component of viral defense system